LVRTEGLYRGPKNSLENQTREEHGGEENVGEKIIRENTIPFGEKRESIGADLRPGTGTAAKEERKRGANLSGGDYSKGEVDARKKCAGQKLLYPLKAAAQLDPIRKQTKRKAGGIIWENHAERNSKLQGRKKERVMDPIIQQSRPIELGLAFLR